MTNRKLHISWLMYFSTLCSLRWFALDFFARGLYTCTAVAHLPLHQLGFLVVIVKSVFCVVSSGHLDVSMALQLSEYLVDETEYVPWRIGLEALRYISGLLEGHPDFMYFKVNTLYVSNTNELHYFTCHYIHCHDFLQFFFATVSPVWAREGCRISPPHFLAECHKRRLNQGSFVLLYFVLFVYLSCI